MYRSIDVCRHCYRQDEVDFNDGLENSGMRERASLILISEGAPYDMFSISSATALKLEIHSNFLQFYGIDYRPLECRILASCDVVTSVYNPCDFVANSKCMSRYNQFICWFASEKALTSTQSTRAGCKQ
jgi:hypothetical protein